MRLKRRKINTDIEKRIITGCIISSKFLREFDSMYRRDYIKLDYAKKIIEWCFDYFDEYGEAPDKNIQTIYQVEKENIDKSKAEIIETFLDNISNEYDGGIIIKTVSCVERNKK